MTKTTFVI